MSAAQREVKRLAEKLVDFYGRLNGTSLAMQVALVYNQLGSFLVTMGVTPMKPTSVSVAPRSILKVANSLLDYASRYDGQALAYQVLEIQAQIGSYLLMEGMEPFEEYKGNFYENFLLEDTHEKLVALGMGYSFSFKPDGKKTAMVDGEYFSRQDLLMLRAGPSSDSPLLETSLYQNPLGKYVANLLLKHM